MWFHVLFLLTLPWWRTVFPPRLFLSPGGDYCWKLWARWTHQEPQRDRYRWVAKHVFFSQPSVYSSIYPRIHFKSPPRFDPPKWPPAIIPLGGITRALPQGLKVYVYSGAIPRRRGQEKWSMARSAGTDWSVSRGVDSSVWKDLMKSSDGFNSSHIDCDVCDITLSFVLLVEEKHWNSFMCVLDEIKGLEIWPFELFWLQSWLFGKKTLWSLRNK